jgi:DHA1 family tetracycline resistance protein-like MFS transporter
LLGAVLALASVLLAVRSLRKHPPVEVGAPPAEALPAH